MSDHSELKYVTGAGGGGGDQHTPVEAPNSLRSRMTARVLFLTSRGEVGGLADQSNPLKSVYFNNTPVQNADGTFNVSEGNVKVLERYGLPSQAVMSGFPSASNTINVGTKVTTTSPGVYTTSVANIDAVRVTVRFPALFQQESNGDTNGSTVEFQIHRKLGSGAYALVQTVTKTDKCISPADADYLIDRPTGAGVWSVKVVRITEDNTSSTKANDIYFQMSTEIQNAQLPYNGFAYIGVASSAETTGSSFPTVAFDSYGIKVKVPSNYNVGTRAYTGAWDGTFSATKQVTDNPAWVLYYLLTDPDAGMGSLIDEADVDKFSFYDAALYNDGLVPAVGGGTEPRYTFNYQFLEQVDAWTMLQNVASSFGAAVYASGNRVKLVQDRPTGFSRLITNSNVIDGLFEVTSTSRSQRSSACVVHWNDPAQNWLSVPAYYEDEAATVRYGLNVKEITGLGVTSEGQAQRLAKWAVDTSINNTEAIGFKVGFANAGIEPGEVLKVLDSNYAEVMNEAVLLSSTGSTATLDRAVAVESGNTFDVVGSDGVSIETRTVTTSSTDNVITFSGGPVTAATGAILIITGAVSPRLFKVTSVREDSAGVYAVNAVSYDPNKFGRVDNTPTGLVPVYQAQASQAVVSACTNITFSEESFKTPEGATRRSLVVKWSPPAGQFVTSYRAFWNKNDGTMTDTGTLTQPNCKFPVDSDGTYSVTVFAFNARGVKSAPATAFYAVNLTTPSAASALVPVTALAVKTVGGSAFTGTDCTVVWSDSNTNGAAVIAGYEVTVCDASAPTTVYRTELVTTPTYTYDLTKQAADNGTSLQRSFVISVRVKDTWGRFSSSTAVTFTNAAPTVPTNVVVIGSYGSVFVTWDAPTDPDYAGTIVWASTTSGFTPSSTTVVMNGKNTFWNKTGLALDTTYYVRVGHYDAFGYSVNGTGMTLSSQQSATTTSIATDQLSQDVQDLLALVTPASTLSTELSADVQDLLGMAAPTRDLANKLDADLTSLANAVTNLAIKTNAQDGVMRDAGIVVDPQTGTVKISAVEAVNNTVSQVQTTLDAQAATITSKASVSYVDGQIAAAVLGGQVAVFDALDIRLTSAETEIDGLNATVSLKADSTAVNSQGARITTVEADIDGLQGTIVLKADNTSVTDLDARVTSAEQTLAAVEDSASSVTELQAGLFRLDAADNQAAATSLAQLIAQWQSDQNTNLALAYAKEELTAKINTDVSAEAVARLALAVKVDDNAAAILSEQTTRATADAALTSSITTLSATTAANTAAITAETTARTTADTATATSITSLTASTGANSTAITNETNARIAAITSEASVRATADAALSSTVTTLTATVNGHTASIASEATTRASADTALSTTLTALTATVGTTTAAIATEQTTRASADTALTTSLNALVSVVDGHSASIATEQTTRATADTALTNSITALTSTVSGHTASIASEATTRASADTALTSSITALTSTVNGHTASIATEQTTRANADSALTTSLNALTSTVNTNTAAISAEATTRATADTALTASITALTSTVNANTASIASEATTRATADSAISSTVSSLTTTVNANTAAITSEATTRASADTAFTTSLNTLTSTVNGHTASISSEATTRSNADIALTSSINTLTSSVGANSTAITTEATTRASETGALFSQYTVKLDTNGYVSGINLASTANNATPSSSMVIRADKFQIANPTGPSISPVTPFTVVTTATTNNGQTVPVGVYMDAAYIKNGSIDWANIGNLDLSSGGAIRSGQTAFNTGTGFWLGHDAGTPKFSIGTAGVSGITWNGSALTVRGDVQATSINAASGTLGTVTAGVIRNSTDTTNMNMNATGSGVVFRSGDYDYTTGRYPVEIHADGDAMFTKLATTGTWTGSLPVFTHTSVWNGDEGLQDAYSNGGSFVFNSGYVMDYGVMNSRGFEVRYTSFTTSHGAGYPSASNCAYVLEIKMTPLRRTPTFTTPGFNQSTNPYGYGKEALFIKVDIYVYNTDGTTAKGVGEYINLTSLSWRLYFGV